MIFTSIKKICVECKDIETDKLYFDFFLLEKKIMSFLTTYSINGISSFLRIFCLQEKETKKNVSIEYLRIFAMIGIVFFHFTDHSPVQFNSSLPININWFVLSLCSLAGGVGNCLFILTTGYLLFDRRINLKRIFYLWLEVLFYSVFSAVTMVLMLGKDFTELGKAFMPITNNVYWFMSSYFCLMLFVPIINDLIVKTKVKIIILYLLLFAWIFSVVPTFFFQNWMRGEDNIAIFILLYALGAIIKKIPIKIIKIFFIGLDFLYRSLFGCFRIYYQVFRHLSSDHLLYISNRKNSNYCFIDFPIFLFLKCKFQKYKIGRIYFFFCFFSISYSYWGIEGNYL